MADTAAREGSGARTAGAAGRRVASRRRGDRGGGLGLQRRARARPRASTSCTSCWRCSRIVSPTGAPPSTRSTTGASSTSTRWPGCGSRIPTVFAHTHQLLKALLAGGKVHAVRIDHPDGLFDPARYFSMLQDLAARSLEHHARARVRRPAGSAAVRRRREDSLRPRGAAAPLGGPRDDRLQLPQRSQRPLHRHQPGARSCAGPTPSSPAASSRSTTCSTRASG